MLHVASASPARAAQAHEYHLVWLPPAPAAPPRLSLCSSKGTLVKVSSLSSAAREGRGVGRVAPSERKTLCLRIGKAEDSATLAGPHGRTTAVSH